MKSEKEMSEPLVSVIIPVYKVEKYLNRCVDSIINQTYKNIEVILVDDGSPDKCGEICDEYAKNDERIVVIHKENGGVSQARNVGVAACHGEYVSFVDSDDYVSSDYIEHLYKLIVESGAEVAIGNFRKTTGEELSSDDKTKIQVKTVTGKEACIIMLNTMHFMQFVTPWGKLYKKELFLNNPFPGGIRHEDEAILYKIYYSIEKVVYSNKVIYGYYDNPTGYLNKSGKEFKYDLLFVMNERVKFFEDRGEAKLARLSYKRLIRYLINDSIRCKRRSDERLFDIAKANRHNKYFPLVARIYVISYKISPSLFKKIKKIF